MKHLVLSSIFFLLSAFSLEAQSKKELATMLTRDLASYRQHSLALNFDSIMYFMPSKISEIIPKDSLIVAMQRAMDNEYMEIEMTGFDLKGKQKIKKAGETPWAFVNYEGQMRLHFRGEASFNKLLASAMKSQFGSDNVQIVNDSTINVTMPNKRMIAFKDPELSHWSFVEDKRNEKGNEGAMQKMIYETVVPEEVRKAVEKSKG